jgi:MGT family glycosyltransferase
MATYVFVNLPAFGHINPTLPIVRELIARGEHVVYFVPQEFQTLIESTGASFRSLPALRTASSGRANTPPGDHQIGLMPVAMAMQAREAVGYLAVQIEQIRPDCMVYNTLSLWARLVAHLLDIPRVGFRPFHAPRVRLSPTLPSSDGRVTALAATADRELEKLASDFRHAPQTLSDVLSLVEDPTLIFMPKEFQSRSETFDERFLFVGPSLPHSTPMLWPLPISSRSHPLRVYVSLGTLRNDEPAFYRSCFDAFCGSECQVVMSVGNRIDIPSLGPIPSNFVVAESVPQLALLPSVNVFISHGGLNSVMESLHFGIPLVVIPTIKEQYLTATRISDLGLGIVLDHATVTSASLREAAKRAANDTTIRGRIADIQSSNRIAGGFLKAADAVQRVARIGRRYATSKIADNS